jgi:hypothetical protein
LEFGFRHQGEADIQQQRGASAMSRALQVVGIVSGEIVLSLEDVEAHWTVQELKQYIARVDGTPPAQLRLSFRGHPLRNSDSLHQAISRRVDGDADLQVSLWRMSREWAQIHQRLEAGQISLADLSDSEREDEELVAAEVTGRVMKARRMAARFGGA